MNELFNCLFFSEHRIIFNLQNEDEIQIRAAENCLFDKYRYMMKRVPFTEILKDAHYREDAYLDACLATVSNIKDGKFDGRSRLKTYFFEIFYHTCVRHARRIATYKSKLAKPNKASPSEELLKDYASDIQGKLGELMSQSDLWDEALSQFRLSDYRCYYVLLLYYSGFSYEDILGFSDDTTYKSQDGISFSPEELGGLDDTPLELNIRTVGALGNFASDCRAKLRALVERLKVKIAYKP